MKRTKLSKIAKLDEGSQGKTKTCPKCGEQFFCRENEQCWCIEYSLSKTIVRKLKNSYQDCLCPDCLRKL